MVLCQMSLTDTYRPIDDKLHKALTASTASATAGVSCGAAARMAAWPTGAVRHASSAVSSVDVTACGVKKQKGWIDLS